MTIQEVIDQVPTLFPGVVTNVGCRVGGGPEESYLNCQVSPDWCGTTIYGYGQTWEEALRSAVSDWAKRPTPEQLKANKIAELRAELAKLEAE